MADPDLTQFMTAPKAAPPSGGAPDLSQFMDKPKTAGGPDLSQFMAAPAKAPKPGEPGHAEIKPYDPMSPGQIWADIKGFTKQRAHENLEAIRQRHQQDAEAMAKASPVQKADPRRQGGNILHTVEDIENLAGVLVSPSGGVGETLGNRLPGGIGSYRDGGKRTRAQKLGDLAEFITPVPVEKVVKGAQAAEDAIKGIPGALEARQIAKQAKDFKATKLPKAPKASGAASQPELAETGRIRTPSEADAAGPMVGNEKHPATRTANALYRLGGSKTADEIEMKKFVESLPKEMNNPETAEALYHAIEQKMVDPKATIPIKLRPLYAKIKPLLDEATDIINELRAANDPEAEAFADDMGYVHRVKAGDEVKGDIGGENRNPFQGKKTLAQTAASQRSRKFFVLEDAKGNRHFQEEPDPDWKVGDQVPGSFNEPLTVKQATTREIEANTQVRYQKDAVRNTVKNLLELRRAKRNVEVLGQTLEDMKARGVAMQKEWRYKDENGRWISATGNQDKPPKWTSLHDQPQFKGWYFDPNDAQVQELKDWLPERGKEDWLNHYDRINNFLLRSNFLSPFIHPKNIAEFWTVARGGDWLHPQGYGRLAKTMPRAVAEVLTMGPAYRRYLREGSALMYGDAATQGFHASLVDKAGQELTQDPRTFAAMMKAFGLKMNPAEAYKRITDASHRMMWAMGDMMMLQRQLELEAKGLSIREAIRKAEETIPNYRVPAQIADSPTWGRFLSSTLRNNRIVSIGRYHYNKLNAWGTMFKKLAKGSPEERKEAFGQFVVAAILGSAVIPAMDKAVQIATGNDKAKIKRGGMMSVPQSVADVATGEEDLPHAMSSVIDISPIPNAALKAMFDKDMYRGGQPVIDPNASPLGMGVQAAEAAAGSFGPTNLGLEALSKTFGPGRMVASQFGVDLPNQASQASRAKGKKYARRQAQAREKKDPIEQMLKGGLQ